MKLFKAVIYKCSGEPLQLELFVSEAGVPPKVEHLKSASFG
jgi:hypothetical protein